ncbi:MAG TPA: type IX secretion system plug protein domain-containing protein, partial [Bacteroidia bacterium]|nr:type IX secretion system plug protein domain-containing protein [Bacteroidia bacterium]
MNRATDNDFSHLFPVGKNSKGIPKGSDYLHCNNEQSGDTSLRVKRSNLFQKGLMLIIFLIPLFIHAQKADSLNPSRLRYDDWVYKEYIKSVQLHQIGWKFSPPIMQLNSGDLLQLDFDDLAGDYIAYSYTLVHCDA